MSILCSIFGICAALTGHPSVTDGDTIKINGQAIRLQGVDAEELTEPNAPQARSVLVQIIGNSIVTCKDTGQRSYKRIVAVCFTADGLNINAEIIRRGAALDCGRFSRGEYRKFEPSDARTRLTQKPYC